MGYLGTFYPCLSIIFLFINLSHFSTIIECGNSSGFSVNLIRKKSPSVLPSRHLMGSATTSNSNSAQSPINAYLGHYLMELSIGTPPTNIYGIADTGSDLLWIQCVPCDNCYNQLNPMFDPQKSSTYTVITCESEQCHKLDNTSIACSSHNQQCSYTYAYASNSVTQGVLSQDTVTLLSSATEEQQQQPKPVSLQGIVFGCGHNDTGSFSDHEMGVIGLGKGELSLISQLGSSYGIKKFSQCLVPFHTDVNVSSKMNFGDGSEVLGDDVVSTPLVIKEDITPYFVTLLGISVGDTYLPFNNSSNVVVKGNMFIDSGTPPTILPQQLYDRVVNEVMNQVALKPIEEDKDLGSQLCYRTGTILGGPLLIAHFEGADVKLTPTQIFIPPKDGVFCLGLTNTSSDGGIYGNFAQSNYLIGFDLDRQVVSFKQTDCTKQ